MHGLIFTRGSTHPVAVTGEMRPCPGVQVIRLSAHVDDLIVRRDPMHEIGSVSQVPLPLTPCARQHLPQQAEWM